MNEKDRRRLRKSEIALIILAAVGLAIVFWFAWARPVRSPEINSYAACAKAGNPVLDSYPSVCVTKGGRRFVNPSEKQTSVLEVKEWNIQVPLTSDISDAYYTYASKEGTVYLTTHRLESLVAQVQGCKTGLHGITYQRSAKNSSGAIQIGMYYYSEVHLIEPLCVTQDDEHVAPQIDTLTTELRRAFSQAQPTN